MAAYQSILAYDGTDFQGFQRLAGGERTVQAVLEQALRRLGWQQASLTAAGRTDAGVHARGQVVAYELGWRRDPSALTQALNAHLPHDVAVRRTELAGPGFHPRFSAQRRRYSYMLAESPQRDPLRERYAWRVWPAPDGEALASEAGALVGRHEFAAFGRAPIPGGHTRREVFRAEWVRQPEGWAFVIEADAFLHHMVRRVVAAMVAVGLRRRPRGEVEALLADAGSRWQGGLAPACGLCLEAVIYDPAPAGTSQDRAVRVEESESAEDVSSQAG